MLPFSNFDFSLPTLLAAFAKQHRMDRLEHDHGIELERIMPDVIKIVLKLRNRVFLTFAVRIIDLRPPGDARLDQMPKMIKRNLFFVPLRALYPLGTRTDQAHLACQYIPKLRQFIETQLSQPAAKPRHTRVIWPRVEIIVLIEAHLHRPELVGGERVPLAANTNLPENRRSSVR